MGFFDFLRTQMPKKSTLENVAFHFISLVQNQSNPGSVVLLARSEIDPEAFSNAIVEQGIPDSQLLRDEVRRCWNWAKDTEDFFIALERSFAYNNFVLPSNTLEPTQMAENSQSPEIELLRAEQATLQAQISEMKRSLDEKDEANALLERAAQQTALEAQVNALGQIPGWDVSGMTDLLVRSAGLKDEIFKIFRTCSELVKNTKVFEEVGTSAKEELNAPSELERAIQKIQKENPTVGEHQARVMAVEANPKLYTPRGK